MSNAATITAGDGSLAAAIKITLNALRYYTTASNGSEKLVFSANSKGIFALSRCALFGATEGSTFPRLDMSLAEGLRTGSGIQSQLAGPDRELLKIDSNGDISCYNRSSGLLEGLTSNACITLQAAGLTVSDRPVVTATGKIRSIADAVYNFRGT